jgi:hypothetical protein
MSLMGHLPTFRRAWGMSAFPPKADIRVADRHVGFGPRADIFKICAQPSRPAGTRHVMPIWH